jgi:4-diphosphocytidyl-2-C-methyl-D-erythritol kinase
VTRLLARAKLTLSLEVEGTRADGYHELDALTVSLSEPYDVVEVVDASDVTVTVDGPHAAGAPVDRGNLAWRAAELLGVPVAIRLTKHIAPGAGLGGGSADAAAVLVARGGGRDDLAQLAAHLGADVPFCLRGGAARMRGIGDVLEPATVPPLTVIVVTPRLRCATPAVYRAWDDLGGPVGRAVDTGVAGLPVLRNDLEPAAWSVEPRLAEVADAVAIAAGRPALLAGSGSSYAIVMRADTPADEVAACRGAIATAVDAQVVVARSGVAGIEVVDA